MSDTTVVVTDANYRQCLPIVRGLARRGYSVVPAGKNRWNPALHSNVRAGRFLYADPNRDPTGFIDDLAAGVRHVDGDILLPCSPETLVLIDRHRADLEAEIAIPIPDPAALSIAHDKRQLLSRAETANIPVPRSYGPAAVDAPDSITDDVSFPVVVKPRKATGAMGLEYASSGTDLRRILRELDRRPSTDVFEFFDPIVQEYVPGSVHDACVLFDSGDLRAALTQRRIWMDPASGGAGVINHTTDEPELIEFARRLLGGLDWHGVAQVEFKRDERTGEPVLLEVNPRFWGTLELSMVAGIDFPALLCELTSTGTVGSAFDYETGTSFVWLTDQLFHRLLTAERKRRSIVELWQHGRAGHTDVAPSDPRPHCIHWATTVLAASKTRIRKSIDTLVRP